MLIPAMLSIRPLLLPTAKVLIAQKTLDVYKQATSDPAAKVFLPLSALPPVLTGEAAK